VKVLQIALRSILRSLPSPCRDQVDGIRKWGLEAHQSKPRVHASGSSISTVENHVHRPSRLGSGRSVNPKIGISQQSGSMTTATTGQDNTWR
jgi:hypothetical protein